MRILTARTALWISSTSMITSSSRAFSPKRLSFAATFGTAATTSKAFQRNRHPLHHSVRNMSSTITDAAQEGDPNNNNNGQQKILRVALCQFVVTHDKAANWQTCADYLDRAAAQGAHLAVLPEIWNSPYATAAFAEYAEVLPDVVVNVDDEVDEANIAAPLQLSPLQSQSAELLRNKAVQHQIWIVGGSIPERDENDNKLYNTCLVYSPAGVLVAKHRKVHLFDIDVPGGISFRESDTLSPGSSVTSFDVTTTVPWGLHYCCTIGVGICYDIRFPEYAMLLTQRQNKSCQILIYPGAFNLTTGPAHWELLQRGRAVDNQCYVLTASPARSPAAVDAADAAAGKNAISNKYPPYTAWGHSTAVAPWGDIVATTDETASIVMADLDLSKVDDMRRSIPVRQQKRADLYKLEQV